MEMVELYQELEKATAARWKPCFMFTIIFVHKIVVRIDDTFGYRIITVEPMVLLP